MVFNVVCLEVLEFLSISLFLLALSIPLDCETLLLKLFDGDSDLRNGGIDVGFVFEKRCNFYAPFGD